MTRTDQDNITRPYLAERWEASDDLKTWTFRLRKVKWHDGRDFTADDAIWNILRCLDENIGSSVAGLMKGYMLDDYDTGEKNDDGSTRMGTRLWDANAVEKVDDHTLRLNLKAAQVAVPEHLFHYPLAILDPADDGAFGVGSNGTGPFALVEHLVGEKSIRKRRPDYWGEGPYIDELQFIDLGGDPSAEIRALASQQVHGQFQSDIGQLDVLRALPHLEVHQVPSAATGVARLQVDRPEFSDPRVRKAFRLAIDTPQTLQRAHRGLGVAGEHHHVCPVHPDYQKLSFMGRDVAAAKALLKEAGYPNGIELEIAVRKTPVWELRAVQTMVDQWKSAGINVKINILTSAQYRDVWDKVPFGFTSWAHRPLGAMALALGYRGDAPWNESHFNDAEFDSLLTRAEGTLDIAKRAEILGQIEKIMQERGPIVQPLWRSIFAAIDKRVVGFKLHPAGYIFGEQLGWKV